MNKKIKIKECSLIDRYRDRRKEKSDLNLRRSSCLYPWLPVDVCFSKSSFLATAGHLSLSISIIHLLICMYIYSYIKCFLMLDWYLQGRKDFSYESVSFNYTRSFPFFYIYYKFQIFFHLGLYFLYQISDIFLDFK